MFFELQLQDIVDISFSIRKLRFAAGGADLVHQSVKANQRALARIVRTLGLMNHLICIKGFGEVGGSEPATVVLHFHALDARE